MAAYGAVAGARTADGTLTADLPVDVDSTDPALDYVSTGWEIEYATCLKLMNYPDAGGRKGTRPVPEAAAAYPKVTNAGKTYDFDVRAGFTRFSNGLPVTAADFKAAIDRDADPKMNSPARPFLSDIVGSRSSPVSGVKVKGTHLIVTLARPAPDFVDRMAMPFFCAIPANLPHDPAGVLAPPSAGPYYISERVPNRSVTLERNPNYHGKRPHAVSRIVYDIGNSPAATYLRVQQGSSDYAAGGIPAAAYAGAAKLYGVGKGRFWVEPQLGVRYLAFNHDRPLFRGAKGIALAKAINFAVDRRAIVEQDGYGAARPSDQILAPGIPGHRETALYPLEGPDFATAKKWAARAGVRPGTKIEYYASNTAASAAAAQILTYDLEQIGLHVDTHLYPRAEQIRREGVRGAPFDIASEGWIADYADPYDVVNVLLGGDGLRASRNDNVAYFDDPVYNRRMKAAAALTGAKRAAAYGVLARAMMRDDPPWAPLGNVNDRILLSAQVGCFTYNAIYGVDLAALCLK